ncbi:glycosyltransferase family 2 protein [Engelhardtia mirabilis]|uniref:Undecaprenyl-phosphate 4-deoxy-4-formamido-L-arabinose transferase n=1 Tax=Engelhardtia mirabilis TaxID=2528011 RepID=A0A518BH42_9BACT|nr:Undecaprenyl-phosphate 4-deoxy-4-formamido-L-arabinose transferase [Planctomycetes bacterium Pla133]QDV00627.1 Undecaprenyl-phosphate 4-deoxy-4-formamido-L-arabinose transferase [Planctomycetes bacterium Pla86]
MSITAHNPLSDPRCPDLGGYPRLRDKAVRAAVDSDAAGPRPRLSLIAPVYNEVDNLQRLADQVREALEPGIDYELLLVDDGSVDGSTAGIEALAASDPRVRGIFFEHNCGQSAATAAGIRLSRGELVATIDADLQNDPKDLPAMVELLDRSGADSVVGYRLKRRDSLVRRISSRLANGIRNWISRDSIRDTGCSLKVFRAEAVRSLPFFNGVHRFLPTLLRYHGFEVLEHPVDHHPRVAGVSKYGVRNRALRAFLDLLAVRWMRSRIVELPVGRVTPPHGAGSEAR